MVLKPDNCQTWQPVWTQTFWQVLYGLIISLVLETFEEGRHLLLL